MIVGDGSSGFRRVQYFPALRGGHFRQFMARSLSKAGVPLVVSTTTLPLRRLPITYTGNSIAGGSIGHPLLIKRIIEG
jgi:hypothetical protein